MDNDKLKQAAKEEKLRYFREWRKNNPEKVKKHNKNYWEKRALKKLQEEELADGDKETDNADSQGNG